jgi:hypothetical protein
MIINCVDAAGNITPLNIDGVDSSGGADPAHPNFGARSIILGIQDAQRVIAEGRAVSFKPFCLFNTGLGYPSTAKPDRYGIVPQHNWGGNPNLLKNPQGGI